MSGRTPVIPPAGRGPLVGLVVNPIAGIGGAAGLAGSDGREVQLAARARGGVCRAVDRAAQALIRMDPATRVLTVRGPMGELSAGIAGLPTAFLDLPLALPSTAEDTRRVAHLLGAAGVDLVMFAGGDGTARDVAGAVGRTPLLGIPAGVKMYSGCFAPTAPAAGDVADRFLRGPRATVEVEIVDLDEAAARVGRVEPRLYRLALGPAAGQRLQGRKAPTPPGAREAVEALARAAADRMRPGVTYLVGPGGTTAAIERHLDLEPTLLGVDVIRDGAMVAPGAGRREIERLLRAPCVALVGVVGGQGFLFGRGNQQLTAPILRRVDDILVVCEPSKLAALAGRPLRVDTGDVDVDRALSGPIRILTGPRAEAIYPVASYEGEDER